ncbi:MAG TPA: hypothetical protein VGJ22_07175 [Anaerolineales bacterium]|jgi:hypothetical protein
MHTGMLWYDNDSHATLDSKIKKAAQYYKNKYGRLPDLCLVHPTMLSGGPFTAKAENITIRPYRPVLPGHIWIGVEDQD